MALRGILASTVIHAGVAISIAAGSRSGHPATASVMPPAMLVEIETNVENISEPAIVPVEPAAREPMPAAPTHTHPYPVAPDHDAHPHDPSIEHDHADPVVTAEAPVPSAPATPAESAEPKRFTLSSNATNAGTVHIAGAAIAAAPAPEPTYTPSGVSVPATLVRSVAAAYPPAARDSDVEGDVVLEIVVDTNGTVSDAKLAHAGGNGFDAAALAAIRSYRFAPAQREGHAVRVRMPWTVQFRLR